MDNSGSSGFGRDEPPGTRVKLSGGDDTSGTEVVRVGSKETRSGWFVSAEPTQISAVH